MTVRVVFDDIEDALRRHLTAVTGVAAYAPPLPTTLPDRSILVRRTGGPTQDRMIDLAQVTVECRAATAMAAERLAADVASHLVEAGDVGWVHETAVSTVRALSGAYLDPDPTNPTMARYSALFQIAAKGRVAS